MNSKWILPLALLAAVACGKDNDKRAQQQEFETVEEGSAAGVTANLSGPGESLPPITSTNADTTSAFAIDPNVAPTATQPEVIAGTLPPPPPPMTSASTPIYVPPAQTAPKPVTPQPKPEPKPEPKPVPPPVQPPPTNTDTATTQPPPPPTQTETAPPPEDTQQEDEDTPEEPTTKTDTTATEEPPPPPPPPNAAPRSATPRNAAPRSATPRSATPRSAGL